MVLLRKLKLEDACLLAKWFKNPEVIKYLGTSTRQGTTLAKEKKRCANHLADKFCRAFIIMDKGRPVGIITLGSINKVNKNAKIFIAIGETEHHGNGIGTEAVRKIVRLGFGRFKLHKIYLEVFADNAPAIRCYEKVGFEKEGILKDHACVKGKYFDEIQMAIINSSK